MIPKVLLFLQKKKVNFHALMPFEVTAYYNAGICVLSQPNMRFTMTTDSNIRKWFIGPNQSQTMTLYGTCAHLPWH